MPRGTRVGFTCPEDLLLELDQLRAPMRFERPTMARHLMALGLQAAREGRGLWCDCVFTACGHGDVRPKPTRANPAGLRLLKEGSE